MNTPTYHLTETEREKEERDIDWLYACPWCSEGLKGPAREGADGNSYLKCSYCGREWTLKHLETVKKKRRWPD